MMSLLNCPACCSVFFSMLNLRLTSSARVGNDLMTFELHMSTDDYITKTPYYQSRTSFLTFSDFCFSLLLSGVSWGTCLHPTMFFFFVILKY